MGRISVRDIYTKMKIKEIANPLCSMLALSMIYNLIHVATFTFSNLTLYYIAEIFKGLLSSVGFYWICIQCWKQGKMTKEAILRVLFIETIYLGIVLGILPALSTILTKENVIVQVIGALVAMGMIPVELIYFYALSLEIYDGKEIGRYIWNTIKRHSRSIFNWFCIGFVLVAFIDTIIGGTFSIGAGIDTPTMALSILFYGNPMMTWMMTLVSSLALGLPLQSFVLYIILYIVVGIWYGVIELNYVLYIQRKCLDDGTSKNTTNKKKNRTIK